MEKLHVKKTHENLWKHNLFPERPLRSSGGKKKSIFYLKQLDILQRILQIYLFKNMCREANSKDSLYR